MDKASFDAGEPLPPTLIEAEKELTLQLELANPRTLEAANHFRLCKAEAHKAEKVRLGGMANVACQEYKDAGVIQQTAGAAAAAAAREDVVQKKAAFLAIMLAQKRLVVDFNDVQRAHGARAKAQLPPICIGPSRRRLPIYRSSTLGRRPPTEDHKEQMRAPDLPALQIKKLGWPLPSLGLSGLSWPSLQILLPFLLTARRPLAQLKNQACRRTPCVSTSTPATTPMNRTQPIPAGPVAFQALDIATATPPAVRSMSMQASLISSQPLLCLLPTSGPSLLVTRAQPKEAKEQEETSSPVLGRPETSRRLKQPQMTLLQDEPNKREIK